MWCVSWIKCSPIEKTRVQDEISGEYVKDRRSEARGWGEKRDKLSQVNNKNARNWHEERREEEGRGRWSSTGCLYWTMGPLCQCDQSAKVVANICPSHLAFYTFGPSTRVNVCMWLEVKSFFILFSSCVSLCFSPPPLPPPPASRLLIGELIDAKLVHHETSSLLSLSCFHFTRRRHKFFLHWISLSPSYSWILMTASVWVARFHPR